MSHSNLWLLTSPFGLGAPKLMVPPLKESEIQKMRQFPASRNGEVRGSHHVQRNAVDLSPDSSPPLLPISSSSQLLHPCFFLSSLFFPTLASSAVLLFCFSLASVLLIPKESQQDLWLWAFCSSEELMHSWSGWYAAATSVSPTSSQLPLSWQPVSQHSHHEQLIDILSHPHCSLCDLGYYYCALFKGYCEIQNYYSFSRFFFCFR